MQIRTRFSISVTRKLGVFFMFCRTLRCLSLHALGLIIWLNNLVLIFRAPKFLSPKYLTYKCTRGILDIFFLYFPIATLLPFERVYGTSLPDFSLHFEQSAFLIFCLLHFFLFYLFPLFIDWVPKCPDCLPLTDIVQGCNDHIIVWVPTSRSVV